MTAWNSFSTDSPLGITSEVITYPGAGGHQVHAYVSRPTGGASAGGIVAVHHMPGWDEFYREFTDRLARHGYTVICPDLYCRFGHGSPDDVAATARAAGGADDGLVVADLAAARDWLLAQPASNGKTGILGTCSGGLARPAHGVPDKRLGRRDRPLGRRCHRLREGTDPAAAGRGHRLHRRPLCPAARPVRQRRPVPGTGQVHEHEAELRRLGQDYEFHRYDGASHGFFYYFAPAYRPEAAMDGWERIFAFFGTHLS